MTDPGDLCRAVELLSQFVDSEPCTFDHHGDCQAHGFIGLDGCPCPNQVATDFVNAHLATHST
ncbi:hypothetical protein [Mycolicibacterium frederiksbergense]|uniref:hypothetical protein n=1 Tax=Mycolicibacterium frederiksbergense TaxID=117567 RepID=UPI00247710EA|nr:hypothetical protein [Mycolicibacterium frederiksbergense]